MQEHLNNSVYLKAPESAVTENFLLAFKQFDIEALDKARAPMSLIHVDSDFQSFARELSFLNSSHKDDFVPSTVPSVVSGVSGPRTAVIVPPANSNTTIDGDIKSKGEIVEDAGALLDSINLDADENEDDFDSLVSGAETSATGGEAGVIAPHQPYAVEEQDDDVNLC